MLSIIELSINNQEELILLCHEKLVLLLAIFVSFSYLLVNSLIMVFSFVIVK
jgi:hypothetical protein